MKKAISIIAIMLCTTSLLSACFDDSNSSSSIPDATPITTAPVESTKEITTPPITEHPETQPPVETTSPPTEPQPNELADKIVLLSKSLIDIPFMMNEATPTNGFDNSGFIYYVLRENGFINWPRSVSEQVKFGTKIKSSELKAGDLVYFWIDDQQKATYGGIYIGDNQMIGAFQEGENVKIVDISTPYYVEHLFAVVRVA